MVLAAISKDDATTGSTYGRRIFSVVWAFAVAGILSELFLSGRDIKVGQLLIYLGMGWACLFDPDNLKAALANAGFW